MIVKGSFRQDSSISDPLYGCWDKTNEDDLLYWVVLLRYVLLRSAGLRQICSALQWFNSFDVQTGIQAPNFQAGELPFPIREFGRSPFLLCRNYKKLKSHEDSY